MFSCTCEGRLGTTHNRGFTVQTAQYINYKWIGWAENHKFRRITICYRRGARAVGAMRLGGIPSPFVKSTVPTRAVITLLQKSSHKAGKAKKATSILRATSCSDSYKATGVPFLCGWPWGQFMLRGSSTESYNQRHTQGTSAIAKHSRNFSSSMASAEKTEGNPGKKMRRNSPEGLLRFGLDMCSKHGDAVEAINLYDKAISEGVKLNQHHYNVLLYLCSSAAMGTLRPAKSGTERTPNRMSLDTPEKTPNPSEEDDSGTATISEEVRDLVLKRGFEIYKQMGLENIPPNEATFTAAARLAVAKEDGVLAFELVKQMLASNIPPKLRSYGPALFAFCKNREVEMAYEVDAHMISAGVQAEEPELGALLKLSVEVFREEKVYSLLHRLRATVRQVSNSTLDVIEQWFKQEATGKVGKAIWDKEKIREAVVAGGGGWHGQGWLGKGNWKVERTTMDPKGVCRCCREQLITIDIDPLETENFAKSLATLACEKEAKSKFTSFQEWLDDHGPFEAIVDGANVGFYQQNLAFSFSQLNFVANGIQQRSLSKKLPLIILHNRHTRGGPANNPSNKQIIEKWRKAGALYTTPTGSNDDWYWLYAAVRFKCLLVTNDEMRDHLFDLLGNSFFPKWKERHQVRFTLMKRSPQFHMPPPYSIVIQESERGSWHIPIMGGDDIETPRIWLCVTRPAQFEFENPSSACQERKAQLLGPEGTRSGAVYRENCIVEEMNISTMEHSHGKHSHSDCNRGIASCSDVPIQDATIGTEVKKIKSRSTSPSVPSIQPSHSRKIWKGQKLSPSPSSPVASPTRLKIPASEMHTDCSVDSKFDEGTT